MACGSKSIANTSFCRLRMACRAKSAVMVDLPTPPLRFMIQTVSGPCILDIVKHLPFTPARPSRRSRIGRPSGLGVVPLVATYIAQLSYVFRVDFLRWRQPKYPLFVAAHCTLQLRRFHANFERCEPNANPLHPLPALSAIRGKNPFLHLRPYDLLNAQRI